MIQDLYLHLAVLDMCYIRLVGLRSFMGVEKNWETWNFRFLGSVLRR